MGLHITSIAQIIEKAPELEAIDYFVYVLNYYQIEDEVISTLMQELPNLQTQFAELGNAIVVTGVKNIDFADDVLSWHNVVGLDAADVCPAILICTLPPHYFLPELRGNARSDTKQNDEGEPWILLELGKLCESTNDLKKLLQTIVAEISKGAPLSNFEASELLQYKERPIIHGKLKYLGLELDHKAMVKKAKAIMGHII